MLKALLLRLVPRCAFALMLAFGFSLGISTANAQGTNVFGRTETGAPSTANAAEAPASASASKQPATPTVLPEPLRRAVAASVRLQSRLNAGLQDALVRQRDGVDWLAGWTLALLSFGYGVLHALGPGHGKVVVSAYLVSHRARVGHAIALSTWSACVQALSAIALVGCAAWLANEGFGNVLTRAASLDLVSYLALLGVGLWTFWSILTRRDCCDDTRISLVPKTRPGDTSDHDDNAPSRYLGARLNAQRTQRTQRGWTPAGREDGSVWIVRQILLTGLAVGVRPCVGAIFVLIAALANGIFMVGVLSAFAMAAGVALTVLVIGLTSLGLNRALATRSILRRQSLEQIRRRFALGGAVFISAFAAWQVFALVMGWQAASLA